MAERYVSRCSDHMADDDADPKDVHQLGWCQQCHRRVYVHVLMEPPAPGPG